MGRITAAPRADGADDEGRAPVTQDAHTGARHEKRPMKWRTRRPFPPGMLVAIPTVYPVASLLFRLRYRHGERIPPTGPVLVVANHISVLDPMACARLVFDNGRFPAFLAKESLFKGPLGPLMRAAGQIPVARNTSHAKGSVSAAQRALTDNRVIVIYP
jgi:1-acyl-sn-glycerol-3-phosphate acyltransferase